MGVFVIPPLGGVERKVTEIPPPPSSSILRQFHRRLDWTHDSRHLIVSAPKHTGGSEGLLLVSVDNGEKTWLTEPSGDSTYGDREPAVSPDGRMVAFARGELGSNEGIHLLPPSRDLRPAGPPKAAGVGRPLAEPGMDSRWQANRLYRPQPRNDVRFRCVDNRYRHR